MEDQGKGRRSASSDRNSGCLELGGLDDADGNKRGGGGREPPLSHDGNMWHVHAAKHAGHRTKQSRVLVDSRHRGAEGEMCPGPKTVPEGPPLAMTLRERSLIALPSVPHATALATKGDQGREGPCLVGTGRSSRVQPMVKAIQDDDTKTSHEEPLATTEMEPALLLQIIGTLFPPQEENAAEQSRGTTWVVEWADDWEVTEEELRETRRMASRNVAPGPDGISGRI